MTEASNSGADQTAAFARMWTDTCAKLMQAAMTFSPETAPPELLRQIRAGLMQALTHSWEEFLRSPQFLEGSKQMMEQAVAFRKLSADFLSNARHATEGATRDDVESLRVALTRVESRLAGQMDALSKQVSQLAGSTGQSASIPKTAGRKRGRAKKPPSGGPGAGRERQT
jgi:hypothetical protein